MAEPFHVCDDVHDAANDAVQAINARLSRRSLRLEATAAATLRDLLVDALQQAGVEDDDETSD